MCIRDSYKGSPQNWDIDQNWQGLMYFANNDGLLEFDGVNWKCYKVSNQTIVRSVKIATDGKIFIGAQGEMGYFEGNHFLIPAVNSCITSATDSTDLMFPTPLPACQNFTLSSKAALLYFFKPLFIKYIRAYFFNFFCFSI